MFKIAISLFVTLFVAQALPSSVHAEEDEIVAAEKNWAKAVLALDFTAMDELYGEDLIYAHSTGVVETKREYLDKLKTGTQKYALIEHQKLTTKRYGDSAVAHATVRMKGTNAKGPFDSQLMLIHVWVKQKGKWRLVAHQTTKLADL